MKNKRIIILLSVCFLILALMIGSLFLFDSSPKTEIALNIAAESEGQLLCCDIDMIPLFDNDYIYVIVESKDYKKYLDGEIENLSIQLINGDQVILNTERIKTITIKN